MLRTLAYCLALSGLATAQIVVDNNSQADSIEPDTTTNNPGYGSTQGITSPLPTLSSACSRLGCNVSSTAAPTCVTVFETGEPLYSIQTNTEVPTGCTRTVYGTMPLSSGASSANPTGAFPVPINSTMTRKPTTSVAQTSTAQSTSERSTLTQTATVGGGSGGEVGTSTATAGETGATNPSMQSGSPANKLSIANHGVGLIAVLGASIFW